MKAVAKKSTSRRPRNQDATSAAVQAPLHQQHQQSSNSSSLLASPPTTVELCGVPIHFPFRPYKCQESYMEKVLEALHRSENALLESPTGTGKTLCLLCSTLAWQREQARFLPENDNHTKSSQQSQLSPSSQQLSSSQSSRQPRKVPTIIYASRTHSQLSQVVRELRNTRYRPKHAVLGSRDQMCVHPKVKTATSTSSEVNHDCAKLAKERKCRYRTNLENGFTPPPNESGGSCGTSSGSTGAGNATNSHIQTQPVMDMEDLVLMGKQKKVCPFYYTRSLVKDAELVLVPYNYLFDKDARDTTLQDIQWENAIVIFDEAHNLESFASDSASFDLSSLHVAGCIGEITRAIHYVQAMPELGERVRIDNLVKMKALLLQLEEYMTKHIPSMEKAYSGEYIFEIFQKGAFITHANHAIFIQEVRKVSDLIMDVRGGGSSSSSSSKGTPQLENLVRCIKLVFGETTEARCLAKARTYRVHVNNNAGGNSTGSKTKNNNHAGSGRILSYWCFAPSLAMQELAGLKLRSILVTSGTLSPLPSYSMELGLRFPHTLENPHIIQKQQVHVRVIGKGVSGKVLSSTYERRDNAEYIAELGNTIVSLARVVPSGMLIFFPSYGVMETCIERWGGPVSSRNKWQQKKGNNYAFFQARRKRGGTNTSQYAFPHAPNYYASHANSNTGETPPSTPWKRLLSQKAVVVEPKSTSDLSDAICEYKKFLNLKKSTGCVLMGVCRGKISEGIDFTDEMCRAVVITGIPFAPYLDPKVKLKREFLDSTRASQCIKPKGEGGFGDVDVTKSTTQQQQNVPSPSTPTTLSGAEWYSQQAHRAVNQAIGRVIRNKTDYGAVLLLDSRFGEERNQIGLSKWLRPHIEKDEGFGRAIGGLVGFYKQARKTVEEQKKKVAAMMGRSTKNGVALEYEKEEEEEENDNDCMTNVAIIQKDVNDHSTTSSSALDEGYVHPQQVLARIDLKEAVAARQQQKQLLEQPVKTNQQSNQPSATGLEALYKSSSSSASDRRTHMKSKTESAWAGLEKAKSNDRLPPSHNKMSRTDGVSAFNKRKQVLQQKSAPSAVVKETKTTAADFFLKAKKLLTSDDFASIRKILVTMKTHGDRKDVRSYMRAARSLVAILARYDSTNDNNQQGKSHSLLDLLIPLLPVVYRSEIETMGLKMKFEESAFHGLCKKHLLSKDFQVIESSILPLLKSRENTKGKVVEYLRDSKPLVEILLKYGKIIDHERNLIDEFCNIIPHRFVCSVQALAEEVKASKRILHARNREKGERGEHSVDASRFRQADIPSRTLINKENQSEMTQEQIESKRAMEAALMEAQEIQRQKQHKINESQPQSKRQCDNPYKRSKRQHTGLPAVPAQKLPSKAQLEKATAQVWPSDKKKQVANESKQDLVASMLQKAVSDPFTKQRSKNPAAILSKMKSHAPKELVCTICSKTSTKPFMADCGHHACIECWGQWLNKSNTCPVCRTTTEKKSLARIVFEQKPGAGAPSLTQMCESLEDDLSSEDEELEIIPQT